MKKLILLRHAKSDWHTDAASDHDRPLNTRGRKSTKIIAEHLIEYKLIPDLVVASDSKRTTETWQRIAKKLPHKIEVRFKKQLYAASVETVLEEILEIENYVETLMVVGHNPTMEWLCQSLTSQYVIFKTANAAVIELDIESWDKIQALGEHALKMHLTVK